MSKRKPTILLPDDPKPTTGVPGYGNKYETLATGDTTDGGYTMIHAVIPPGDGAPPHQHANEDEGFFVLGGEITFYVDGEYVTGKAGTFINIPKNTPHGFRNESDQTARMLFWYTPAGLEKGMAEALADFDNVVEIAKKYGMTYVDVEWRSSED